MQVELGVSERRACQTLGQARAVQRYTPQVRADEAPLAGRVIELAAVYGCYGTPQITALLRQEGWLVNHKRADLAAGRLKSAAETAQTWAFVVERRQLRAAASGV